MQSVSLYFLPNFILMQGLLVVRNGWNGGTRVDIFSAETTSVTSALSMPPIPAPPAMTQSLQKSALELAPT